VTGLHDDAVLGGDGSLDTHHGGPLVLTQVAEGARALDPGIPHDGCERALFRDEDPALLCLILDDAGGAGVQIGAVHFPGEADPVFILTLACLSFGFVEVFGMLQTADTDVPDV